MYLLPNELLLELVQYLRPQRNIGSLMCTASWLQKRLYDIVEMNQTKEEKPGLFSRNYLLTPFQHDCLEELSSCFHTTVPDVDNGTVVLKALFWNLIRKERKAITVTYVELEDIDFSFGEDFGSCLITRSYSNVTVLQKREMYSKTEIIFTSQEVPPREDKVKRYCILVSDYCHPVDEYTPLWTYSSSWDKTCSGDLLGEFCGQKLGKVLQINEDVLNAGTDISLSNYCLLCHGQLSANAVRSPCIVANHKHTITKYQPKAVLKIDKNVYYSQLADYDTIICCVGPTAVRIASLLMQFSTRPKKLLTYCSTASKHLYPFPAKMKYQYFMECFGGESKKLVNSGGFSSTQCTYAELCALSVGYNPRAPDLATNWVTAITGKCDALEIKNDFLWINNGAWDTPKWTYLNPLAEWQEPLIRDINCTLPKPLPPIPQSKQAQTLREKVEYSLTCTRGSTNGDSLTLAEAKDLCKSYKLRCTGSRKELLERLLTKLQ